MQIGIVRARLLDRVIKRRSAERRRSASDTGLAIAGELANVVGNDQAAAETAVVENVADEAQATARTYGVATSEPDQVIDKLALAVLALGRCGQGRADTGKRK